MSPLKTLAVTAACLIALGAHAAEDTIDAGPTGAGQDTAGFDMMALAPSESAPATAAAQPKAPGFEMPRVGIHIASHHWPSANAKNLKFNNENPGLYLRWKNGITGGFYRNSDFRNSLYGGWTWAGSDCGPAVTFGVISGYKKGTIPLVVPSMCVLGHVRLMFIPRVEPKGAAVLHVAFEF